MRLKERKTKHSCEKQDGVKENNNNNITIYYSMITIGHSQKYHNTCSFKFCISIVSSFSGGNKNNAHLDKIWRDRQRILWYFPKWPMEMGIDQCTVLSFYHSFTEDFHGVWESLIFDSDIKAQVSNMNCLVLS